MADSEFINKAINPNQPPFEIDSNTTSKENVASEHLYDNKIDASSSSKQNANVHQGSHEQHIPAQKISGGKSDLSEENISLESQSFDSIQWDGKNLIPNVEQIGTMIASVELADNQAPLFSSSQELESALPLRSLNVNEPANLVNGATSLNTTIISLNVTLPDNNFIEPFSPTSEIQFIETFNAESIQLMMNPNVAPDDLSLDTNVIDENSLAGTFVGTLTGHDSNAGDILTYSLIDDAGGRFAIDTHTGILTVGNGLPLDYETAENHSITVQVQDQNGLTYQETFTIHINNVAEPGLIIFGTPNKDILIGGPNDDTIYGLAANDILSGLTGDDTLYGEQGNDILSGGQGHDILIGGPGNDTYQGGTGNDTILISGTNDQNSIFFGDEGNDIIQNIGGNDFTFNQPFTILNSIEAIDGNHQNLLGTNSANHFDFSQTVLTNINQIDAKGGHDTVRGSQGDDNIRGGSGNDTLYGEGGNDLLYGDGGNDTLYGGFGNDTLTGGAGTDTYYGGEGNDTFLISGNSDQNSIFDGGEGHDIIQNTGGNFTFNQPFSATNSIEAIDGNNSNLLGTNSANHFDFSQTVLTNINQIDAKGGHDTVRGSQGDDNIRGGSGDDTIYGEGGNDMLYGDQGNDLFTFANNSGTDMVDGGAGNWIDTIRLNAANQSPGGIGEGSWLLQTNDSFTLDAQNKTLVFDSKNADGSITLHDGSQIDFSNIEKIEWS